LALEQKIIDWPSEYHLSSERSNLLRCIDLSNVNNALEIGCGCGAITRYLGEQDIAVDAVEGSTRRAEIARLRCEDMGTVEITGANINDLKIPERTYEAVLLIGVLEYASRFQPDNVSSVDAIKKLIKTAYRALKDDGILVIAIENRLGLKYIEGCTEDHYARPYIGIYNYPNDAGIRTYTRKEWEALFHRLEIAHYRFCYPFPDYKLPTVILSDDYINNTTTGHEHLFGIVSRDYNRAFDAPIDEYIFWEGARQLGCLGDFANSFLIVAAKSRESRDKALDSDFIHISDVSRKPAFRTITKKLSGKNEVIKNRLYPNENYRSQLGIDQDLMPSAYIEGRLLSSEWLRVLKSEGSVDEFEKLVRKYYQFVEDCSKQTENQNDLLDVLPFNIIVSSEGEYMVFDREWRMQRQLRPQFILFRALLYLYFIGDNQKAFIALCRKKGINKVSELIAYCFSLVEEDFYRTIDEFIELEDRIQAEIRQPGCQTDTRNELAQTIGTHKFHPKVYWAGGEASFSEEFSISKPASYGVDRQTIRFQMHPVDGPISRIRFDPAEKEGFFHIYIMKLTKWAGSTDDEEVIFQYADGGEVADSSRMINLEFDKCAVGKTFRATNADPQIIIELPQNTLAAGNDIYELTVEMDWPHSADYLVAKNSFIKEEAELKRKIRQLEIEIEELVEVKKERYIILQPRIWKTAKALSRTFCDRMFAKFPVLRRMLLAVRVHGPKR